MRRKELFYYVTWGSNVTRDVHWCVTGFYQQIEISNVANQIHGFTIDYGKFTLKLDRNTVHVFYFLTFSTSLSRRALRESLLAAFQEWISEPKSAKLLNARHKTSALSLSPLLSIFFKDKRLAKIEVTSWLVSADDLREARTNEWAQRTSEFSDSSQRVKKNRTNEPTMK